ncbi:MAG: hypothetical protein RQ767_00905, partial [Thermovirgaceae bacterium]|nr:hypothetical protein [Thermovirgaceae bacterium]
GQLARPSIYVVNHLSLFDIFVTAGMPVFDVVICLRSWPFKMVWFRPFMRLAEYMDIERLSWDQIVQQVQRLSFNSRWMQVPVHSEAFCRGFCSGYVFQRAQVWIYPERKKAQR